MAEPKKLIYDSGEQPEEVFLRVSGYLDRDRLYVGIYQTEYGYPELFSDLTVNLHHAPLNGVNEAYIDHNFSKDHLRFIQKYKLGQGTAGDRSFRLLHLSEGRLRPEETGRI